MINKLTILLSALAFSLGSYAHAQNDTVQSVELKLDKVITSEEAFFLLTQANEYSKSSEGIAIIAIIGNDFVNQGFTPQQVADIIVQRMTKIGANSRVFLGYNGDRNTAITFLTRNNEYGPFGAEGALQNMPIAAKEFLEEQQVRDLE